MAAGEPEDRAVALAEQAVLDAQGGGQIKDLAQVQRGSAVFKLFTNFYSYGSLLYHQTADAYGQRISAGPGRSGSFSGTYLLLYTFPAFASILLASAFRRDEDEEGWLHALGRETLGQMLNTMVLLRELGGLARLDASRGYEGPGRHARHRRQRSTSRRRRNKGSSISRLAPRDRGHGGDSVPASRSTRCNAVLTASWRCKEGRTHNPLALLTGPPRE